MLRKILTAVFIGAAIILITPVFASAEDLSCGVRIAYREQENEEYIKSEKQYVEFGTEWQVTWNIDIDNFSPDRFILGVSDFSRSVDNIFCFVKSVEFDGRKVNDDVFDSYIINYTDYIAIYLFAAPDDKQCKLSVPEGCSEIKITFTLYTEYEDASADFETYLNSLASTASDAENVTVFNGKGSADTGIADIPVICGLVIISAGTAFVLKKKR